MDCLSLAREGGSTGNSLICQSQAALNNWVNWGRANPVWTVGLLFGVLILLTITWRVSRSIIARQRDYYEAKKRAEALLRASITNEQYQQLLSRGYMEIPSQLYPGYTYRIPRGQQRVQIYETNQTVSNPYSRKLAELCIVPCDPVPDADMVLAHKLMIEADEQTYLSIANRIG
jgi:hypothetical protein